MMISYLQIEIENEILRYEVGMIKKQALILNFINFKTMKYYCTSIHFVSLHTAWHASCDSAFWKIQNITKKEQLGVDNLKA